MPDPAPPSTDGEDYAERLRRLESAWWKRALDVQGPYRRHLRRIEPGFVLDLGCGVGRNLVNLGGHGVGVDHNATSVAVARSRGLTAFTPQGFASSEFAQAGRFDSILCSHVAEHMTYDEAASLVKHYLPFISPGGRVIFITPQERGFRSDETHVTFMDFDGLRTIVDALGLSVESQRSFPFPRWAGKLFPYNEFVLLARVPGGPQPARSLRASHQ